MAKQADYDNPVINELDDLHDLWAIDCKVDRSELGKESTRVPELHARYLKLLSHQRIKLRELETEYKVLYKDKCEYYQGKMNPEEMHRRGWEHFGVKLIKSELQPYIDSDKDLNVIGLKILTQKEIVDSLADILKAIHNRGYQIRAGIDWAKFIQGQ